ncbi:thylakoid membrane photosystem I accumulation factor [Dolichospermum sp. ST_con]|nr:thylakoid membrane photosystem I accumulation factor [Dolichospermum sp. ST_con]MDD1422488.1 thylakoid membrane photosystem I accumulation factor [Dolichospermum sp. ST_sed1]MDD1426071.1 thylakoid membrane photosystem I accumulation factor [Dolichospermum sp. ST_sed9]MDD1432081.1 thylakoid membrane photosystem I accumulation factor [Dolichospermum sp. ST_sed6]MDD1436866.1 thylakoid membrane photosystem I accumulation factor [Dolichospermum sp. ST_sed10]MDD1443515.1 thylakoid membrane photos
MNSTKWLFLQTQIITNGRRFMAKCLVLLVCLFVISMQPALAGIKDDRYDGNIFVIYAGNGSLVPSKETLAQTLAEHKPAIMTFYTDDSSDCKQYAPVISEMQAFYGRATEIIPISVDTILADKTTYQPTEPGYYYGGSVPQVVIFDQSGKVVFNQKGQVPFEEIDDKLREVFDLLPRTESLELKRRSPREFSSQLEDQ